MRYTIVFALGLCLLAGCGSARRGEPLKKPVEISSPELQDGQIVFMRVCNQCHPQGDAGLGPAINNKALPAAMIKTQVRNGLGAMPKLGSDKITDQELDDVIKYLQALRKAK